MDDLDIGVSFGEVGPKDRSVPNENEVNAVINGKDGAFDDLCWSAGTTHGVDGYARHWAATRFR